MRLLEKYNTLRLPFLHSSGSSFSPQHFRNIGEFGAKKYFIDHRRDNTIQLFAIKGNFSGLSLF